MSRFALDPGPCEICGAAHATCTAGDRHAPITAVMAPARDASVSPAPPLVCDVVQATLPPGQFTSGTYRGKKKA